jgi:repressor LexA
VAALYGVSVDWLLKGDRTIRETRAGYALGLARPAGGAGLEELSLTAVPVLGAISAGGLVEAWQEDLGTLEVPTHVRRLAPRAFGLRVYGSSLASEWINDGSIVVVDPDAPFVDGKIYAVRLDGGQVAARRVIEAGPVLKLVTGDGEVSEYPRLAVAIIGRVRWSFREH